MENLWDDPLRLTVLAVLAVAFFFYIKLLRSGYMKQLGTSQRSAVLFIGAFMGGAGMATLNLMPGVWGSVAGGVISGAIGFVAMPWVQGKQG